MAPSIRTFVRKPREEGLPMRRLLKRVFQTDDGQDLAEYGIALALVAGFVVIVALSIAGNVQALWSNAQSSVEEVVAQES